MNELKALAGAMIALREEKERQERLEIERIKETNMMLKRSIKLEYLQQRREWRRKQRQISYQKRQQRHIAELEATKILYQDEIEKLSILMQNSQGIEAERLQLLLQKRELEIMEIEQELAGFSSESRSLISGQIQQIENQLEMIDGIIQAQKQMALESQLRQMEEEKLREEAERITSLKQELSQKYPPDVVQNILMEMRRLQAMKRAQEDEF